VRRAQRTWEFSALQRDIGGGIVSAGKELFIGEELEGEDKALEEKYLPLAKKRQQAHEKSETVKALEQQRTMTELLKKFKADG
jgi:hypothetical protein